mmetsp:Transcript_13495/g.44451  ORF Transcript_13495/g.44451 Transcript_13495/m.44451 type:complete len:281 (+) Transcript_13495:1579-2421(+)
MSSRANDSVLLRVDGGYVCVSARARECGREVSEVRERAFVSIFKLCVEGVPSPQALARLWRVYDGRATAAANRVVPGERRRALNDVDERVPLRRSFSAQGFPSVDADTVHFAPVDARPNPVDKDWFEEERDAKRRRDRLGKVSGAHDAVRPVRADDANPERDRELLKGGREELPQARERAGEVEDAAREKPRWCAQVLDRRSPPELRRHLRRGHARGEERPHQSARGGAHHALNAVPAREHRLQKARVRGEGEEAAAENDVNLRQIRRGGGNRTRGEHQR